MRPGLLEPVEALLLLLRQVVMVRLLCCHSKTAANSLLHAPTRRRFGGIFYGLPELIHDNLWGVP